MASYRKHVAWSDEDQAWIATAPDFPGLSASGASDIDALAELNSVLEEALETYSKEGWPLPVSKPFQSEFSGQLRLRLPRSVHAQAVQRADEEGVSLNALLQAFITHGLGSYEAVSIAQKHIEAVVAYLRTEVTLHELSKQVVDQERWVAERRTTPGFASRHYALPAVPGVVSQPTADVMAFPIGTEISKRLGRAASIRLLPIEAIQ